MDRHHFVKSRIEFSRQLGSIQDRRKHGEDHGLLLREIEWIQGEIPNKPITLAVAFIHDRGNPVQNPEIAIDRAYSCITFRSQLLG
ncbi:hypothetical protein D3C76_1227820 [compost metagenome]